MAKKPDKEAEVIAFTRVRDEGPVMRGRLPAPVVKALGARDRDVLAFERRPDGAIVVRLATVRERRSKKKKD
jgi:bifunctional DNA-binding transcriptional regulator/antitoxin component of YhaV-PrlF toxin-antitoxin module